MARNVYGLDLGSYEIKVYDKKKDTIWKEKDVIALKNEKEIFAVGDEAFSMYEKAPSNIEVVFPMKEGVISRFHDMQFLLQNLLPRFRFRHSFWSLPPFLTVLHFLFPAGHPMTAVRFGRTVHPRRSQTAVLSTRAVKAELSSIFFLTFFCPLST